MSVTRPRARRYVSISHNAEELFDVGVNVDGTLHNPNGYPEGMLREALEAADARRHAWRSRIATKAAVTRKRRHDRRLYEVAERIRRGVTCGPRQRCVICGRELSDRESVARGIGSECWQDVLAAIDAQRSGGQR